MTDVGQAHKISSLVNGRYRIERLLGQGGMGAVYAATDLGRKQTVALKRLLSGAKPEDTALLKREFRTLSTLRHPRIVEVFDYGADSEGAFYTMELLEGGDLAGRSPMSWREACACLRDAASILGVLHARKLVHRDLSPRNFWQTTDGRLKLLDFGALAPFGPNRKIVGTAPFVAPEALRGHPLDQRTDLFGLGALGYWLLTSTHAYHATSLGELPRLWEREPAPPSRLLKLIDAASHDVPEALDRLIMSLLRSEPNERPHTTADVIDTLNAIAQLEPEANDVVVHGYLNSSMLVGRARECEAFASCLAHGLKREPRTLFIEGPEGVGRSRLLAELVTMARLSGAAVLTASPPSERKAYAAVDALTRSLLVALPMAAMEKARPYASALGQISSELFEVLGSPEAPEKSADLREGRVRKQAALLDWFFDLSREHALVVLVDDVHLFDEESQAFLSALAQAPNGYRLVVAATADADADFDKLPAVQRIRASALRVQPLPLTSTEVHELLHNSFGDVQFLERLAKRLHQIAEGNPRHVQLLIQHLVQTGAIRYTEGNWVLPMQLPEEGLPSTLRAGFLATLGYLDDEARGFARRLSVPDHGALPHSVCGALLGKDAAHSEAMLRRLTAADVVRSTEHGLTIAHEAMREALWSELDAGEQKRVHLLLAQLLAESNGEPLTLLRTALHFLRAGQQQSASPLVLKAVTSIESKQPDQLRGAAPVLEQIVAVLDASKADDAALYAPLFALGTAGYYVDRVYASRYGDRAVETLCRLLQLPLAAKMQRLLGQKAGLLSALTVAGISLKSKGVKSSVPQLVTWLLTVSGVLAGTAATCLNGPEVRRYNRALQPLRGLGVNHAAGLMIHFNETIAMCTEDRLAETNARVSALMETLQHKKFEGLTDDLCQRFFAGLLPSHGHRANWAGDPSTGLAIADKLSGFGPTSRVQAEQLRAAHHALNGRMKEAEHHRKLIDRYSIQMGSAWQAELWVAGDAITDAMWTHDAVAAKRAAQQLARLGTELPTFARWERSARGTYLLLRGRPREALAELEPDVTPRSTLAWSRSRGQVAEAHNMLGDHERARAICQETLALMTPEDLKYVIHCLNVPVELAMAEAHLGELEQAKARLDTLIAEQTPLQGALMLGYLHRARARVALLTRDFTTCQAHIDEMARWYDPTRLPSLLEQTALMRQALRRAQYPELDQASALDLGDQDMVTRVRMLMTSGANVMTERVQKGLQIALELAGASSGFIVLQDAYGCAAQLGDPKPDLALLNWAEERLLSAVKADETAAVDSAEELTDQSTKSVGPVRYCVSPLWATRDGSETVVAALVLGFADKEPRLPRAEILRVIAEYLAPLGSSGRSISGESSFQPWQLGAQTSEPANANASPAADESGHPAKKAQR